MVCQSIMPTGPHMMSLLTEIGVIGAAYNAGGTPLTPALSPKGRGSYTCVQRKPSPLWGEGWMRVFLFFSHL